MNILIINAFGSSPKAVQKFDSFCHLIKNIFRNISKGSGIESFNFICRSPNNISEFIYKHDMISGDVNQNKRNKKNFDKIDIVIIDGYEKYAPWDQRSYTLCEFIKLCKITNKTLYAGGVGFEILMYYLATGSLNEYNFVNAKGQIKSLEEMSKAPKKFLKELKSNDIFLDFVTGDILEYKGDEIWGPIKNIGMHKQLTAEKYMYRGKFVLKENFRGKDFIKNENAYSTTFDEIKIKISKQYFHHYLFENLPLEFISMTTLTWFPHFLNVLNQSLQFKILCESEKGPVVIEHKNSTGVLFHIIDKYRDSVLFMENFIKNKFNEIQNKIFKFIREDEDYLEKHDKSEIPAIFKYYISSMNQKKNTQYLDNVQRSSLDKVKNSLAFGRIKNIKNEANHVGFSINNRDMIFVENNYINQNPIVSTKKNKNILFIKSDEENMLNFDNINNIFTPKTSVRNKNSRKNINIISYNEQENNINNKVNNKKRKKNLFLSFNKKKNIKNDLNNNLFLTNRNSNNSKIKYRLKSSRINNRTVYNNLNNDKNKLPKFNINLKKKPKTDEEEFEDLYTPKYPRPAVLSGRREVKTPSHILDVGYFNNNENKENNNNVNFFNLGLLNKKNFQTPTSKNY